MNHPSMAGFITGFPTLSNKHGDLNASSQQMALQWDTMGFDLEHGIIMVRSQLSAYSYHRFHGLNSKFAQQTFRNYIEVHRNIEVFIHHQIPLHRRFVTLHLAQFTQDLTPSLDRFLIKYIANITILLCSGHDPKHVLVQTSSI